MNDVSLRGRTTGILFAAALVAACGDDSSGTGGAGGGATTGSTSGTQSTTTTGQGTTSASSGQTSSAETSTGSGGDPTGSGGGGGSTSSVGGGSASFPDDCASAADCPNGECVEVGSGFRACQYRVEEATECTTKLDECCTSEDCGVGGGLCVSFPDASYCGGPQPQEQNVCSGTFGCVDCGKSGGTCLEAGFYGYNTGHCIERGCFSDDDCGEEAGGRCAPIFNPCCRAVVGLFCAYPSDGCRDQQDCGADQHCEVDLEAGRARCVEGIAKCPA